MGSLFSDNSYVFLHLLKDGDMKLFNSYQTSGGGPGMYGAGGVMMGGGSYSVEKLIMQKEGGELFRTGWLNFKRDMIHYLSDCQDLAMKIEQKIYRSNDIEAIVYDYNQNCR
jgi:hypothetical protein